MIDAEARGLTLGNIYRQKITSDGLSASLTVTFAVIPDAYYIDAVSAGCQTPAGVTAVVLPGHPATRSVALIRPIGDVPAASNVAGIIDAGLNVRLLWGGATLTCSSHVNLAALQPLDITLKPGAYYAALNDSDLSDRAVFLTFGDAQKRATVLLPVPVNGTVSITSTYLRFDATRAALDRNASPDGSTIACPRTSGESPQSPAPLPSAPSVYTLYGVALGSSISGYVARRGKPDSVGARSYVWRNGQGGALSVTTDSDGTIVVIDVKAGASEIRSVEVLGRVVRFNDGGHMNEPPPDWVSYGGGDKCGPSLNGSPCWVYLLPRNAELVMNFGGNNGTADWNLTEVVLGSRAALLKSGMVTHPSP